MNIKQALQNPFALVAQGFVVGAVLIFTTAPQQPEETAQPSASAIVAENIEA